MKNAALLLGLFFATVAVSHSDKSLSTTTKTTSADVSPLWSLLQKSFTVCINGEHKDRATAVLVAKHDGLNNRKANCLRACVLTEADLINDDTNFNSKKFKSLLRADKSYTHEMVSIFMGMAKICAKFVEEIEDKCIVAQTYFLCVETMVGVKNVISIALQDPQ